jgi:hypothetical protein
VAVVLLLLLLMMLLLPEGLSAFFISWCLNPWLFKTPHQATFN